MKYLEWSVLKLLLAMKAETFSDLWLNVYGMNVNLGSKNRSKKYVHWLSSMEIVLNP